VDRLLAVCCLGATDSGAIKALLVALGHSIRGRISHLLQFEVAVNTVVTLLGFGLVAVVLQAQPHGDHQALHGLLASLLPEHLEALGVHLLAGLLAGLVAGAVASRLIDALVRSEPMLLLVAVALALVAFGFGQLLGGGGLLAVFVAGELLSNGHYRIGRFEQQALGRVMHPLNTADAITLLPPLGQGAIPALGQQHGATGPAQLHHVDGIHRRLAGRRGRAAAHHMPEVVGVAHPLVQQLAA